MAGNGGGTLCRYVGCNLIEGKLTLVWSMVRGLGHLSPVM